MSLATLAVIAVGLAFAAAVLYGTYELVRD